MNKELDQLFEQYFEESELKEKSSYFSELKKCILDVNYKLKDNDTFTKIKPLNKALFELRDKYTLYHITLTITNLYFKNNNDFVHNTDEFGKIKKYDFYLNSQKEVDLFRMELIKLECNLMEDLRYNIKSPRKFRGIEFYPYREIKYDIKINHLLLTIME